MFTTLAIGKGNNVDSLCKTHKTLCFNQFLTRELGLKYPKYACLKVFQYINQQLNL